MAPAYETLFYTNMTDCPWYEDGDCSGTKDVSYNGHVNDQRVSYMKCDYFSCPIFHWIEVLADSLKG